MAVTSAIDENPLLHAQIMSSPLCMLRVIGRWIYTVIAEIWICADTQVSVTRILHSCRPFCSCDLDLELTQWPSYTNLTRTAWRYTGCATTNFLRQGLRKLWSDGQTDRQTDRHESNYKPRRFAGGQQCCYTWTHNATQYTTELHNTSITL